MTQYVFPDVELKLRELGLTFDVVDLRWGMTDAFGDNHGEASASWGGKRQWASLVYDSPQRNVSS